MVSGKMFQETVKLEKLLSFPMDGGWVRVGVIR
jgi:hypothetical protein